VELAIVLVILALLAGGLMMTLSAQQEARRLSEVRRQLADIREALLGYAAANGRLPPPANATIGTGYYNAGVSDENFVTNISAVGVIPWVTLGLPETDPWGYRFSYRVAAGFAGKVGNGTIPKCDTTNTTPPPPAQASFALCSLGDITVLDRNATTIAKNLPAIVISHGRNGLGGYGTDGKLRPGATNHENTNITGSYSGCPSISCFFSHEQTPDFDDEVVWIPLPILMNRMISAGRLP
jgi:type II secretory pathway pseudopilin PulG